MAKYTESRLKKKFMGKTYYFRTSAQAKKWQLDLGKAGSLVKSFGWVKRGR